MLSSHQMSVSSRCRLALASICLVAATRAIHAQQIHGLVRDSATSAPVPGAVVSLLDEAGKVSVRTIADASGRFHISRPAAGRTLEVLRIGFRPRRMPLSSPSSGQDAADIVIDLLPVPTLLDAVAVEDRAVCPRRADHDQALALWEQARAALLASVVARRASPAKMETLMYDRELDRDGRVVSQRVGSQSGTAIRPFYSARAPSEFAKLGYVTDQPTGGGEEFTRMYDAPDADVLLDESFASTHCFQIARANLARPGDLGLSFEPAAGRDSLADVAGILWVRASPAALESIEFRYTGLEPAAIEAAAGGSISFATMPNGVVFIDRWSLRMPILVRGIGQPKDASALRPPARRSNRDLRVSRILEHGGAVATALWDDGPRFVAPLGGVRGRVSSGDAGAGVPMANAVVWLEGAARRATTDAAGTFAFERLLAGPYTLQVSDSSLAAFSATRTETQQVVVRDSVMAETKVDLPSRDRALERVCGKRTSADRGALFVHLENARSPDRSAYVAQWNDAVGSVFRAGHLNSVGLAAVCDVPIQQSAGVAVRVAEAGLDTTVFLPPDRIAVVTARVPSGRSGTAPMDGPSVLVVRVAVTSPGRSTALDGVEVAVAGAGLSARTNADGVAVFRGMPPGTHNVLVHGPGHAPVVGVVDLLAHDSLEIPLRVARILPGARVATARAGLNDGTSGFEKRRTSSVGYFLTEDSIAARAPSRTTELFQRVPGVRVFDAGDRIHVYSSQDQSVFGNPPTNNDPRYVDPRAGKQCELAVWFNGAPMDTTFDINSIPPSDVHGIEVYRVSNTPAQFNVVSTFMTSCGSLVIWTK
jgi:Carboxypeptidase regulatory-like domain/TonB-dependent Receptor Plug Domain